MTLISRVVLFAAVAAVFTFVTADNADAQLFKRLFNRGCCCKVEEPAPEPEPEPCVCEAPAPEPCPAPEPAPMPCCEPAPEPVPMMPCCAPAPEPTPMPCCEPAPAPEPAPMPCCEPAPTPCCSALLPSLGPGETLIAVYPMSIPAVAAPEIVSPVISPAVSAETMLTLDTPVADTFESQAVLAAGSELVLR